MENTSFEIVKKAVADVDGNTYDGIAINGKMWMASNLRTIKYNDNTLVGRNCFCLEQNLSNHLNFKNYGMCYNFAALQTGKLAPKGWRVPSKKDWEELFAFLMQFPEYNQNTAKNKKCWIAKSICSQSGWKPSKNKHAVGNNQSLNNSTGLNIFPSDIYAVNYDARLWSCTEDGSGFAQLVQIFFIG